MLSEFSNSVVSPLDYYTTHKTRRGGKHYGCVVILHSAVAGEEELGSRRCIGDNMGMAEWGAPSRLRQLPNISLNQRERGRLLGGCDHTLKSEVTGPHYTLKTFLWEKQFQLN